jgi:hypothetical protein
MTTRKLPKSAVDPDLINYGDCLNSLGVAMESAGGATTYWTLEDMSAIELISIISTNQIRFVYTGEKK